MAFPDYPFTREDEDLYHRVRQHTITQQAGVVSLIHCVQYVVKNDIPGAIVECGVYRGGTAEVILRTLQAMQEWKRPRELWLFDTFNGLPKPDADEIEFGVGSALATWKRMRTAKKPWVSASLKEAKLHIHAAGYPEDLIYLRKGMVEKTIPNEFPRQQLALLRLDTDFYSSTRHELEHLYPRLSSGGIVIVDDYGAFSGSKRATDEYREANSITAPLEAVDGKIHLWVKP